MPDENLRRADQLARRLGVTPTISAACGAASKKNNPGMDRRPGAGEVYRETNCYLDINGEVSRSLEFSARPHQ
jgi:hypothetical protein